MALMYFTSYIKRNHFHTEMMKVIFPLDDQKCEAIARASSQLFPPIMNGSIRSVIIRNLSFTTPISLSEETRVMEQSFSERFQQEIVRLFDPVVFEDASCPLG